MTLEANTELMSFYSIWIIEETKNFLSNIRDIILIEGDFILTMDLLQAIINEFFNFERKGIMLSI